MVAAMRNLIKVQLVAADRLDGIDKEKGTTYKNSFLTPHLLRLDDFLGTTFQSMTVQALAPRDVETTLNYYNPKDDDGEPPYYYQVPREGMPSNTVTKEPVPVVIRDTRGKQDALGLGLDVTGFQWLTYPSAEKEFVDEERIKKVYYAEVEDMLKKHAGAKRVFVFDHTIRRGKPLQTPTANSTERQPVQTVHVDQTPADAANRVLQHLPEDAERLMKGRYQIINVWRPIVNLVAHHPLGVADFRSVDVYADLVPTRLVYPTHETESYVVKHNPRHEWYYLSDQTPNEVTIFKCFDSDRNDGKASFALHSAFFDAASLVDAPHRQSIEVRALVFDRE